VKTRRSGDAYPDFQSVSHQPTGFSRWSLSLRKWLHGHVLPAFAGRVLAVDAAVALRCARLHVPDELRERDAMIAATALVHGMTVVTRNVADFEASGVPLLNPWLGPVGLQDV
jgi:predicted nucleic acid-binding protein